MSVKTLYPIPLLLLLLLFSTAAQAQLQKIYLQPKTVAREKQSKYIDSIHFIPLEIKEGIELGSYYNVEVADKYLLLTDYNNKKLILYTRDGRFIKSISYKNLGGDFYPSYQEHLHQIMFFGPNKNYALTPKDHIKIKLDWANPRNKKYFKKYIIDLNDSSLAIQKAVTDEKDIVEVEHLYGDYYLQGKISTSSLYTDSLDYEMKLYKDNQLLKEFFPYNHINDPRYLYTEESISFNKTDTPYINTITRPYCDTIYRLIKDSLHPFYQVVLPLENSLPASFYIKSFKDKTERENFRRNNGWMMHQINDFYETPRFLFFGISYLSNYDHYVYEKKTEITYKTKNIKADSSQYNLSLLAEYGAQRQGDHFYKPLRASDLIPFFEKNKSVPIPKELEAFLASKPPDTTPVIVAFKLKN